MIPDPVYDPERNPIDDLLAAALILSLRAATVVFLIASAVTYIA
jgi:hypothetical protein